MPPSGTTAGTASDVYRTAALRLHGPTLLEPVEDPQAGYGIYAAIRHNRGYGI